MFGDISGSVEPLNLENIERGVYELWLLLVEILLALPRESHHPANVVRLAWRLTHHVDVVALLQAKIGLLGGSSS